MKIISPITFIDRLIKKNELGQPFALMDHQREILRIAFDFDKDGRLAWDTILYSCVKKSGKTTINGALTLWWALTQEAPNEVLALANDREQALSRTYATIEGLIQHNRELQSDCEVQAKVIYLANGTTIKALASDAGSAAGSNHGWTSWDELWAYTSEASRRLWEELTGVPTRRNSVVYYAFDMPGIPRPEPTSRATRKAPSVAPRSARQGRLSGDFLPHLRRASRGSHSSSQGIAAEGYNRQAEKVLLRSRTKEQRLGEVQAPAVPGVRDRRIYAG